MPVPTSLSRCLLAASLSLVVPGIASAETAPGSRREVPIKLVTLPDGARRFTVPVVVGGTKIEAGLDTGSVGLRVLPATLKAEDATATEQSENMRYGGGAMYDGVVAKGAIDIGGLNGEVRFQQVRKVGCIPRKPDCGAAKLKASEYGMMGDGLPGAGFKAILGVGSREVAIDNPLRRLGVTRFIVELPRDKDETGRLILNPTQADAEGFKAIPAYKRVPAQTQLPNEAVNGCMEAKEKSRKICGALTFDSGSPGITVVSPDPLGEAWAKGTKIDVALDDGAGKPVVIDELVIGSREDAAALRFREMTFLPKTIIRMGIAPYLTYSVLYDFERPGLSVKQRPPKS